MFRSVNAPTNDIHRAAADMFAPAPSQPLAAIDLAPGARLRVQGRKSAVTVVEVIDLYTVVCAGSRGKNFELLESNGSWFRVASSGSHTPYRPIAQPTVAYATDTMKRL